MEIVDKIPLRKEKLVLQFFNFTVHKIAKVLVIISFSAANVEF